MTGPEANLREGEYNYHDRIFEEEIIELINITDSCYASYVCFIVDTTSAHPTP